MTIELKEIIHQLPENISTMDISLHVEDQKIMGGYEIIPALVINGKNFAGECFSKEIETITFLESITGIYFLGAEERTKQLAEQIKKYYSSREVVVNIRE